MRGYGPGRFSFNVKGRAMRSVRGRRHHSNRDAFSARRLRHLRSLAGGKTLQSRHARDSITRAKNIAELLNMTVLDAVEIPSARYPPIRQKLETLRDVGLDYIHLGQSATTLSGRRGTAHQARQGTRATRNRPHVFTSSTSRRPASTSTTSRRLLGVLGRLADAGNTIVVNRAQSRRHQGLPTT